VNTSEIHAFLKSAPFGGELGELQEAFDPFLVIPKESLLEIATFLRDSPELQMEFLQDETATDHPSDSKIRMVYHLCSYKFGHSFKLKVELDRAAPSVPTLERIWPVANWFEREVYDLFGVHFEGHSDLRRIMLPDDWEGHPLRKDYQDPAAYHGIDHERFSPIDGYTELDEVAQKIAEETAAQIEAATTQAASAEAPEETAS